MSYDHQEIGDFANERDAQDWAEMMLRMYVRWAERSGMDLEIESLNEGTEAGISSATAILKGRNAYGWMRSEHGVHRLVRISPFDNNARRQTSFASVKVTPWIDDGIIAAQMGLADRFAYSMTKGAVLMMTYSIAKDFIKQGIRCNCICPGTVETPSLDGRMRAQGDYEAARKAFVARQPMQRLGTVEAAVGHHDLRGAGGGGSGGGSACRGGVGSGGCCIHFRPILIRG